MPQMAPSWWTTMYFMVSTSFLFILMILYFQSYKLPINKENKTSKNMMNWKW
uniref:ATP synthase F0 subunit 8 n=1 Tax=Triatoma boliviana TaxID=3120505 RepID=UPI0030036999